MRIETLAERFKARKMGAGYKAKCPAHDDGKASLQLSPGTKANTVLHCHAGCTTAAILAAAGLRLADLFDTPTPRASAAPTRPAAVRPVSTPKPAPAAPAGTQEPARQIVATYPYRDEAGQLLFEVVRFAPKDFRQRRPDPAAKGGWNWSTKDVRRVIYRLPETLQDIKRNPAAPVWIVEGEKDVAAIVNAGGTATCNAGGAGKWLAENAASLASAKLVVIIADKDVPGRKHARAVAASLTAPGRRVVTIETPAGKDAAEFLESGGTLAELEALAFAGVPLAPVADGQPESPKLPACVFETARQRFFIPAGREWIPVSESRVQTHLKAAGFAEFVKDQFGVSVLEAGIQKIVIERNVAFAGQVAGRLPGVCEISGERFLITRGPRLIEPKAGKFPKLMALLESMFLDKQHPEPFHLFNGWLLLGYQALLANSRRPAPALCLCGKSDCGKSFIQSKVITPILGGRSANPYRYMVGKTDFNSDLIAAEHLTIDDEASEKDIKSRQALGANVKKMVVGHTVSLHPKGRDAITVECFARLSFSLNDDPADLMILPPMEESVKNKFILLLVRSGGFPVHETADAWNAYGAAIAAELPAYLHWLTTIYKFPAEYGHPRYGVRDWQHPDLMLSLEDLHPWRRLVELLDHVEPWNTGHDGGDGETWQGTVADLEEVLKKAAAGRAGSVLRGPQGTGMDLRSAAQRLPHRISSRLSQGRSVWIIAAPNAGKGEA